MRQKPNIPALEQELQSLLSAIRERALIADAIKRRIAHFEQQEWRIKNQIAGTHKRVIYGTAEDGTPQAGIAFQRTGAELRKELFAALDLLRADFGPDRELWRIERIEIEALEKQAERIQKQLIRERRREPSKTDLFS